LNKHKGKKKGIEKKKRNTTENHYSFTTTRGGRIIFIGRGVLGRGGGCKKSIGTCDLCTKKSVYCQELKRMKKMGDRANPTWGRASEKLLRGGKGG